MIVAVTSIVVFEVPEGSRVDELRQKFYDAHRVFIGQRMETVTGQTYVLRAIEFLEVERRPAGGHH
jgi:hypothetical protein